MAQRRNPNTLGGMTGNGGALGGDNIYTDPNQGEGMFPPKKTVVNPTGPVPPFNPGPPIQGPIPPFNPLPTKPGPDPMGPVPPFNPGPTGPVPPFPQPPTPKEGGGSLGVNPYGSLTNTVGDGSDRHPGDGSDYTQTNPGQSGPEIPPINPTPGGMPGTENNPNTGIGGVPTGTPTPPLPGPPPFPDGGTPPLQDGPRTGAPTATPHYAPIQGFDIGKIESGGGSSGKYTPALRDFSEALGSGVQVSRGHLDDAVSFAKAHGLANAHVVGDDKIDFGDGNGPIDVITSNGQVWFQNGEDRFGGGGQPGGGSLGTNPGGSMLNTPSASTPGVNSPGVGAGGGGMDFSALLQQFMANQGGGQTNQVAPPPAMGAAPGHADLDAILKQLMSGDLNQGIVNRRVDSARDTLNKQRASASDTLGAQLASMGQLTGQDGAQGNAQTRLDRSLNNDFAGTVNDIYANEGQAADSRMMSALTTSAGLSEADAQHVIDQFNAQTGRYSAETSNANANRQIDLNALLGGGDLSVRQRGQDQQYDLGGRQIASTDSLGHERNATDRMLGIGSLNNQSRGLDLTQRGQDQGWNQFLAQNGLDRDTLNWQMQNGDTNSMLQLMQLFLGASNTAAGGHV